jgi:hypothetical protein
MKIRLGSIYGNYKVVMRDPNGGDLYGVINTVTSNRSKMTSKQLEAQVEFGKDSASLFQEYIESISDLLVKYDEEKPEIKFSIGALKTVCNLIPVAEQTYKQRPDRMNANALTNLLGQAREAITDIKNAQSNSDIAAKLSNDWIIPAFSNIGANITNSFTQIGQIIGDKVNKSDRDEVNREIRLILRSVLTHIQDSGRLLSETIKKEI